MQNRHIGLMILLLLLAIFAAANWSTISNATEVNFLIGRVEAPFGLIMLGVVAFLSCLYAVLLLVAERRLLRENVQQGQDLKDIRDMLSQALEQLTELRAGADAPEFAASHTVHASGGSDQHAV